jgi:hypothetical protein
MDVKGDNGVSMAAKNTGPAASNAAGRELITLADLAREANTSTRFLQKEIQRGKLRALRLSPRLTRVRRADYERYLDGKATPTR